MSQDSQPTKTNKKKEKKSENKNYFCFFKQEFQQSGITMGPSP